MALGLLRGDTETDFKTDLSLKFPAGENDFETELSSKIPQEKFGPKRKRGIDTKHCTIILFFDIILLWDKYLESYYSSSYSGENPTSLIF